MIKAGFVSLVMGALGVCLAGEAPHPVKLEVDLPVKSISVGERAKMNVRLVDADNRSVAAPKDFMVDIVARLPSNATEKLASAVLKAGQSSIQVELPPANADGWLYIWAKQPELRLGGAFLRVNKQGRSQPPVVRPPAGVVTPSSTQPPMLKRGLGIAMEAPKKVRVYARMPIAAVAVAKPGQPQPAAPKSESVQTTPPPPPPPADGYLLALRYSPQRTFLANGKDSVTVHAFVIPKRESPLPGFRIELFDTSGTLKPVPLVIPPGVEEGTATLTSDHEGQVKVEYLSSTPKADLDGDRVMAVSFDPPITGFELKPSPPRISLVDTCDLIIRLVDDKGTPIATNARRTVSLALATGRGDFSMRDVPIDPDQSSGRATFTPVWWGTVMITASTPNLVNVDARLDVDPPLALLGISLAGGLVGGYVFMLKRRGSKHWRVALGALTGVILLWACLFLGLTVLPRAAVLNPISVFVISVFGGWLGTGVFEPILKRLGLGTAADG